jgi:hypothetical protein
MSDALEAAAGAPERVRTPATTDAVNASLEYAPTLMATPTPASPPAPAAPDDARSLRRLLLAVAALMVLGSAFLAYTALWNHRPLDDPADPGVRERWENEHRGDPNAAP